MEATHPPPDPFSASENEDVGSVAEDEGMEATHPPPPSSSLKDKVFPSCVRTCVLSGCVYKLCYNYQFSFGHTLPKLILTYLGSSKRNGAEADEFN